MPREPRGKSVTNKDKEETTTSMKEPNSVTDESLIESNIQTPGHNHLPVETQRKRGRGRPKKVVKDGEPKILKVVKMKETEVTTNTIGNSIVIEDANTPSTSTSIVTTSQDNLTTRKRGRPEKINVDSNKPPKKRGRPCKAVSSTGETQAQPMVKKTPKRACKPTSFIKSKKDAKKEVDPTIELGSESEEGSEDESGEEDEWKAKSNTNESKETRELEKALKSCKSMSKKLKSSSLQPVATKRRGRPCKTKETSSEIAFSMREKTAFLNCLTERGFNVIYNAEALAQVLPGRTQTEIKFLIECYSRRGKELAKKNNDESDRKKNPIELNSNKCTPIELWFEMIHQLMSANAKKDDMSALLANIFEQYSLECQSNMLNDLTSPNYSLIYKYISEVLRGKCPPELRPVDGIIIIKLMEELNELVMSDECSAEKRFLAQTKWKNCISSGVSADLNARNMSEETQAQDVALNGDVNPVASTSANTGAGDVIVIPINGVIDGPTSETYHVIADENNELACHLNLPKIRKIVECLNPLQVPLDILKSEASRWSIPSSQ